MISFLKGCVCPAKKAKKNLDSEKVIIFFALCYFLHHLRIKF